MLVVCGGNLSKKPVFVSKVLLIDKKFFEGSR